MYLGGYGFGANDVTGSRPADGILGDGIHVRAFAVSDGGRAFAIADIETQGWFTATKDGPYGIVDMRKAVEQRTGGRAQGERGRDPVRPLPLGPRHDRRVGRGARWPTAS